MNKYEVIGKLYAIHSKLEDLARHNPKSERELQQIYIEEAVDSVMELMEELLNRN